VLVNLKGANLEHTGSIAGMSGSPIFLKDDQGRERMIGAFAYGWPLMKDPVGGVQPIEYMLAIKPRKTSVPPPTQPATTSSVSEAKAQASGGASWKLSDAVPLPGMESAPASYPFAGLNTMRVNPRLGVGDDGAVTRLRPLATPLMTTNLPSKLVDQLGPILKVYGMVPLQAGSGSSGSAKSTGAHPKLEPGSVLAVPLLTGDVEMTAVGTCTERIGDRVVGFGHPFNNEGAIAMPLGGGEINGVIANLMTSFKLGAMTDTRWKDFFDKMARAGLVKSSIDYKTSYTLKFVNKGVGVDLRPKQ